MMVDNVEKYFTELLARDNIGREHLNDVLHYVETGTTTSKELLKMLKGKKPRGSVVATTLSLQRKSYKKRECQSLEEFVTRVGEINKGIMILLKKTARNYGSKPIRRFPNTKTPRSRWRGWNRRDDGPIASPGKTF